MSGAAASASASARLDTELISHGEMVDQARAICGAVSIPVLGDGDTGYGNAMNVSARCAVMRRPGQPAS